MRALLSVLLFLSLLPPAAFASSRTVSMKRSEIAQYEGEYAPNGRKVRKSKRTSARVRKPASYSKKRKPAAIHSGRTYGKKKSLAKRSHRAPASRKQTRSKRQNGSHRKPASKSSKSKKSHAKKSRAHHLSKVDDFRLPYVRKAKHERDLPFMSIPNSRVVTDHDKTIVMDDPNVNRPTESSPPSVLNAHSSPEVASAPEALIVPTDADLARSPASGPREPDAYDLHSGTEPTLAR
ncbi:MAG: hypothetical protein H7301_07110 [Cryobacterium sp.]|nr:hypothetical protein [Oligoflexia bacterium]